MNNATQPAFPVVEYDEDGGNTSMYGLTKREYMATHILAGLLADDNLSAPSAEFAQGAVHIADALINELNKETP